MGKCDSETWPWCGAGMVAKRAKRKIADGTKRETEENKDEKGREREREKSRVGKPDATHECPTADTIAAAHREDVLARIFSSHQIKPVSMVDVSLRRVGRIALMQVLMPLRTAFMQLSCSHLLTEESLAFSFAGLIMLRASSPLVSVMRSHGTFAHLPLPIQLFEM